MDIFNEAWKWDQAEQGPSHSPAESFCDPDKWHVFSVAQAAIRKSGHDISFLQNLVFHVQLKALQVMAYFLPCFFFAAIIEEPCFTSAL